MKLENRKKFRNIMAGLLLLDMPVPWDPLGSVPCPLAVALTADGEQHSGGDWGELTRAQVWGVGKEDTAVALIPGNLNN